MSGRVVRRTASPRSAKYEPAERNQMRAIPAETLTENRDVETLPDVQIENWLSRARSTKNPPRIEGSILGGFRGRIPAITDFRATRHYHGPGGLNGRVRNGNGCDPASMVAGKVPSRQ